MRNSQQPSGPGQPARGQRDQATENEEIDETLNPQAERQPPEGRQPGRQQPSPQVRNSTLPPEGDRRKR